MISTSFHVHAMCICICRQLLLHLVYGSHCILQADKSLRLLAFLQNTLRSAADRINKSNFRGRCGTVNYHTCLNL